MPLHGTYVRYPAESALCWSRREQICIHLRLSSGILLRRLPSSNAEVQGKRHGTDQRPSCEADCWAIPRMNLQGCILRYAFYRLLAQGFRRCQSEYALSTVALQGQRPARRQFYHGRPLSMTDGIFHTEPWSYHRVLDGRSGQRFYSIRSNRSIQSIRQSI